MKREDWVFQYPASKLLEAAKAKQKHHESRLAFWQKKKAEITDKIRADGIEVDESLAGDEMSKLSNYNRTPTVQIRDDFVRDLAECVAKVKEHHNKAQGYAAWVAVIGSAPPENRFDLEQDDWLYFFGK